MNRLIWSAVIVVPLLSQCGQPQSSDFKNSVRSDRISGVLLKPGLKTLERLKSNQELRLGNLTPLKFEQSLTLLSKGIELRGSRAILSPSALRSFSSQQKLSVNKLVNGLNKALAKGTIKSIRKTARGLILSDGTRGYSDLRPSRIAPRLPGRLVDLASSDKRFQDGSMAIDFLHDSSGSARVRWRWRWWGVKIGFTHKATSYLCKYTTYVLNVLPLPGWAELVMKPLACSLHSRDSDKDGITLNVTWVGAFWFSDKY